LNIKRRVILRSAAAASALSLAKFGLASDAQTERTLIISDGFVDDDILPENTVRFSKETDIRSQSAFLDLSEFTEQDWKNLRASDVSSFEKVQAFSSWQSFVVLADLFREKQWRLISKEKRVDLSTHRTVFNWQMLNQHLIKSI